MRPGPGGPEQMAKRTSIDGDTIVARATPPGRGGIAVIRISGADVRRIAEDLVGRVPQPRFATLTEFVDASGESIDSGIALFFPGPKSFTGEDVLELQGHGGLIVCDLLIERILDCSAFTVTSILSNPKDKPFPQAFRKASLRDHTSKKH